MLGLVTPRFHSLVVSSRVTLFLTLGYLVLIPSIRAVDSHLAPGLKLVFQSADPDLTPAVIISPQLALYVPVGQSASPFLAPGPFTATWTGFVSSDLRREYRFQAELSGGLELEINGQLLLKTNLSKGETVLTQPIRLQKGPNPIRVEFRNLATADSSLRLNWSPKRGRPSPVPAAALSHAAEDADLRIAVELALGRRLIIERRCVRCHALPESLPLDSELNTDAPVLEGIGSRLRTAWLAQWILNPKSQRSGARMPQLFHGTGAERKANAVAAFLASLTSASPVTPPRSFTEADRAAGASLFDALHCAACHLGPDASETDPDRLSLKTVAEKFQAEWLIGFLQRPEALFTWSRMPNFHLSESEATRLAAYLFGASPRTNMRPPSASTPELLEEGRRLVETSGCLSCHSLALANRSHAPPLRELSTDQWDQGCLTDAPGDPRAPFFAFSAAERTALRHWAASDRASLGREVPTEFTDREISSLRCQKCHGQFDGFPPLDRLVGKLRPEWFGRFLAGHIPYKPRPWLPARMPSFPAYASRLAAGFAMQAGLPPRTPLEPPVESDLAKVGRQLTSTEGGLSCVACHAVGAVPATQVFDNAGINLAWAGERLLKSYFERWLSNPLAIDPVTKMPAFFDEDLRSPLTTVYDGDGRKQMEAIWQYLRLGDKMPAPPGAKSASPTAVPNPPPP